MWLYFLTQLYTYPTMSKWKNVFRNLCKFVENEIQNYPIYKSIHTHESILCRSTSGSNYSYVFLGKSLKAFHTWVVQYLLIILFIILQDLSNWFLIIARQPFSDIATDFQEDLVKTVTQPQNIHCLFGKQIQSRFDLVF